MTVDGWIALVSGSGGTLLLAILAHMAKGRIDKQAEKIAQDRLALEREESLRKDAAALREEAKAMRDEVRAENKEVKDENRTLHEDNDRLERERLELLRKVEKLESLTARIESNEEAQVVAKTQRRQKTMHGTKGHVPPPRTDFSSDSLPKME